MHVSEDEISDVVVARIVGTLDATYAQEVHEGIMPILLTQRPILMDFTEVPYVSHAGLRTMLAIYRQAQAIDGKVAVVGIKDELYLALSATGFIRFFLVADSVDEGLRTLRGDGDAKTGTRAGAAPAGGEPVDAGRRVAA